MTSVYLRMKERVAVCCSVLQGVAGCCSVLQRVATWCTHLAVENQISISANGRCHLTVRL